MRPVLNTLLISLFVLLPAGTAFGTDEIVMGSPYHKFDPATGYYSIVHGPATPATPAAAAPPVHNGKTAGGIIRALLASWIPSLVAGGVLLLLLAVNFVKRKPRRMAGEDYPR